MSEDDDTPLWESVALRVHLDEVHPTDVLMQWTEDGPAWFSCIKVDVPRGRVFVQNQNGELWWLPVSTFNRRYALVDTGRFNLRWRFSPIQAVANAR